MASIWRQAIWLWTGYRDFTKSGYEARAAHFNASDIGNVTGRSFVVTGANAGLGRATTEALLALGGTVHMVCRSRERGEAAIEEVRAARDGNCDVHLHLCDVSNANDIRRFASEFTAKFKCNVLVNNAGVMLAKRDETDTGLEKTFATNTIGTFLMTELMLPCLLRTAQADGIPSRVIAVSSGGMLTQPLDMDDLQSRRSYGDTSTYSKTKRHQVILNELWAKQHEDQCSLVQFYSMHPGWADTPGVQNAMPGFREKFASNLRTMEQGADTIVWLAVCDRDDVVQTGNGKFFLDRSEADTHLPWCGTRASDEDRQRLYDECKRIAELTDDELQELRDIRLAE